MDRLSWDEFYMEQAVTLAKRATCKRLKVGTIITKNNLQFAEGYNGSIIGHPHCEDEGCLLNDEGRCIRTVHAEQNAILNAMKKRVSIEGGTVYVTAECCEGCSKLLAQSGIKRIVFLKEYPNKYNHFFLKGIEVEKFNGRNREELLDRINKINKK